MHAAGQFCCGGDSGSGRGKVHHRVLVKAPIGTQILHHGSGNGNAPIPVALAPADPELVFTSANIVHG